MLVFGSDGHEYTAKSYDNDISVGCRIQTFDSAETVRSELPSVAKLGQSVDDRSTRYLNRDGGWVHATGGIIQGMKNVTALGGKIIGGKEVKRLIHNGGRASGVECSDGSVFTADLVVIATGSWTPSALPVLNLEGKCTATGYSFFLLILGISSPSLGRALP